MIMDELSRLKLEGKDLLDKMNNMDKRIVQLKANSVECELLIIQYHAMISYYLILERRIREKENK